MLTEWTNTPHIPHVIRYQNGRQHYRLQYRTTTTSTLRWTWQNVFRYRGCTPETIQLQIIDPTHECEIDLPFRSFVSWLREDILARNFLQTPRKLTSSYICRKRKWVFYYNSLVVKFTAKWSATIPRIGIANIQTTSSIDSWINFVDKLVTPKTKTQRSVNQCCSYRREKIDNDIMKDETEWLSVRLCNCRTVFCNVGMLSNFGYQ